MWALMGRVVYEKLLRVGQAIFRNLVFRAQMGSNMVRHDPGLARDTDEEAVDRMVDHANGLQEGGLDESDIPSSLSLG